MIVRRVPIDFAAVSKDTGIVNGTIGHGALGWVVRDNDCKSHYSVSLIDPPAMLPGETRISISDNHWCFHND